MSKQATRRPILPLILGGVALGVGAAAAYRRVVRPWYVRWGASDQEVKRALPGDEIVESPHMATTRAISIDAPIAQVWQWVVQIGQYRGGLYLNEGFEHLFGESIENAETILPQFQTLQVGEYVQLLPNGPGFGVAALEPERMLVLRTINSETGEFTQSAHRDGMHGTLTFYLEPRIDHTTRLVLRTRFDYEADGVSHLMWGMFEPFDFVIERQVLQGIKTRAEAHPSTDALLDRMLPAYEFRGIESIRIHATPEQIMQAFSEIKGSDMPLAQLLGQLRYLPSVFTKHEVEPPTTATGDVPLTEAIMQAGFVTLAQEPQQMVLGAVVKFHALADQEFVHIHDAPQFQLFMHEDYQKIAISLRIADEDPVMGCRVTLEHRTHALSEHARKLFARYWIALKPGGGLVTRQVLGAVKHRAEAIAKQAQAEPLYVRERLPEPQLMGA